MKSTIFITSSNNNLYLYDFLKKEFFPTNQLIKELYILDQKGEIDNLKEHTNIETLHDADLEYYLRKYKKMKECGYFQNICRPPFLRYTSQSIKKTLSNVNNIVFEVTNQCNLSCTYCINGPLYNARTNYEKKFLSFDDLKSTIDYFLPLWDSASNNSPSRPVSIGFYGGEPLLNFTVIKKFVEYCNNLKIKRKFKYTMTTNATLLDKYIDFLVKYDFLITISLDGDKEGQSHRVFKNGKQSFDKVYNNLKMIMNRYPIYWDKNVQFNSVLHNKNDVYKTHQFILSEFKKIPEIHPLNNSGVRRDKQTDFNNIFKPYYNSNAGEAERLASKRFTSDPKIFSLCQFLLWYGRNQYFDYESFLYAPDIDIKTTTGTCRPFSRKFYITSEKNILVCEKINQKYAIGMIDSNGRLNIDLNYIAEKYNEYYNKIFENCKSCYMLNGCNQCIFQLDDLESPNPKCWMHKSEKEMIDYIKSYIDLLENDEIDYTKIINECVFS